MLKIYSTRNYHKVVQYVNSIWIIQLLVEVCFVSLITLVKHVLCKGNSWEFVRLLRNVREWTSGVINKIRSSTIQGLVWIMLRMVRGKVWLVCRGMQRIRLYMRLNKDCLLIKLIYVSTYHFHSTLTTFGYCTTSSSSAYFPIKPQ